MPETVVKDRNVDGVDRVRNGVGWKGRSMMECDGKVWNVMEGLERDGRSRNGARMMSERQEWT